MSEQPTEYGKELIEAVARALCKAARPMVDPDKSELSMVPVRDGDGCIKHAGFYQVLEWHKRTNEARAALLAACAKLKEPSEAMLEAAAHEEDKSECAAIFRAMLSQLLPEIGSPGRTREG